MKSFLRQLLKISLKNNISLAPPSGRLIEGKSLDESASNLENNFNDVIEFKDDKEEETNLFDGSVYPQEKISPLNKSPLSDSISKGVDAEMEILMHAISNLNDNTKSHSDNSANSKYEETLNKILNNKKTESQCIYFERPKLKTTDEFASIMNYHRKDFGPSMRDQMIEVNEYIKNIFDHVRDVIRKTRPNNSANSSQMLTDLVAEITELSNMADLKEKNLPLPQDDRDNVLSDSELSGFLSAISDDDREPQEDKINNEITTGSDFALKPQTLPKDTDEELRKMQELARVEVAKSFEPNLTQPEDKPENKKDLSNILFDSHSVAEEQHKSYIPSLGEVLNEVLNKKPPLSYIRHQNNNSQALISQDLRLALDDVYAEKSRKDYEDRILKTDTPKNTENNRNEKITKDDLNVKTEIVEKTEAQNLITNHEYDQEHFGAESEENEFHQEVVGGNDFKRSFLNKNKASNNEKIVDGKPTQDKSYEVSLFEGDNRALGRQMRSSDFYDDVLSFDSWLKDVKALGFDNGPVYAALSYTSRCIDINDNSHWILNISSDFKVLAEDPKFLTDLTKRFSLLKNKNLRIELQIVNGIPEGSPEYLAQMEHIKAVQKARDDMSHCREIALLLNHLGEDPQTVNLALYLQLPAPATLKKI